MLPLLSLRSSPFDKSLTVNYDALVSVSINKLAVFYIVITVLLLLLIESVNQTFPPHCLQFRRNTNSRAKAAIVFVQFNTIYWIRIFG